jgi:3'-phosphoadenosine 5'-phosphosulfate (PAPS) 3'-phosphatase
LKLSSKSYFYKKALNIIAINATLIKNIIFARKQMFIDKKQEISFSTFEDKEASAIFYEEIKETLPRITKFQIK